jgi:tetratricopeptide (TPR) repeat protein
VTAPAHETAAGLPAVSAGAASERPAGAGSGPGGDSSSGRLAPSGGDAPSSRPADERSAELASERDSGWSRTGERSTGRPAERGEWGARGGAAGRSGGGLRPGGQSVRRAGRTTAERRSTPAERRVVATTRPKSVAPSLPDEARPELLDAEIRKDLRGLPTGLAESVARHLVAAAMFLEEDAALALAHARAAASLAARLPATREAAGIAAYHAGEYATALIELRTARRMDGSPRYLPMIADAERGLGRPERAIDYLTDPAADALDPAGKAELLIVGSGARRDLGQAAAAVVLLADEANRPGPPRPWTARLRYAYAEALLDAGRAAEALRAFEAAAAVDEEGETDAEDRAYELRTRLPAESEPAVAAPVAEAGTAAAGSASAVAESAVAESAVAGEVSAGEPVRPVAGIGKGVAPVLFDDGSAALAQAAERADPARGGAALPDLSVLFSGLGLREIPADERGPVAPLAVETSEDDVLRILDEEEHAEPDDEPDDEPHDGNDDEGD